MAIYNDDITGSANITAAVNAFLSQFTISANGDIRHTSGTDTFHVKWLHRSLQKLAWDFTVSGDDEINLTKPNPSKQEALHTIITLYDYTADYGVNYNIDDNAAEFLFGGSVTQNNGDDSYSALCVLGSVANAATELQVIQNNTILTSHWGTGKNQTASTVLLRILIKAVSGGTTIDGKRVIVKANEWGDTYDFWRTELGLTESVAVINTYQDPLNTTPLATVQAYTEISNIEGYQLIDVGNGGDKPYYSQWSHTTRSKNDLYEFAKSQLVRGSALTVYGVDANKFAGGPTFKVDVAGTSGTTLVQNETLTWTTDGQASSGVLMAADDLTQAGVTEVWVHILTGVPPKSTDVLTGTSAIITASADATNLIPNPNQLGLFTGSAFIGAYGVGFNNAEVNKDYSLNPLDNSGPISPPNVVVVNVTVNGATNAHVFLAKCTGGVIDQTQYTAEANNNVGNSVFVVKEALSADTPTVGYLLVKETDTFEFLQYTSWSGSTFTLSSNLAQSYTEDKDVIVPLLYHDVPTDGGVATTSLVQTTSFDVCGWVRHGDPVSPDRPVAISGAVEANGLNLVVQLEDE